MKCPECGTNTKKSVGTRCGKCGYGFKLVPPEQNAGIGDARMASLLEMATGNGTYHVTPNQVYGLYARKMGARPAGPLLIFLGAALGAVLVGIVGGPDLALPVVVLGFIAFVALWTALSRIFAKAPPRAGFVAVVDRWRRLDGKYADRILLEDEKLLADPPPEWREPDIYDYGVSRIVIVERDALVDLLVRNELHAQEKALVLSSTGYPGYLLPVAERLLRENPTLPVFVLHDTLPPGEALNSEWWRRITRQIPIEGHPVTDLGLTTEDVPRIPFLQRVHEVEGGRPPVDLMPWAILAPMLGAAFLAGEDFAHVLAAQGPGSGGSDSTLWGDAGDFG